MNQDRLTEVVSRIDRMRVKLAFNTGPDFKYSAMVEGEKQNYLILGMKNPADRKDEIVNLMVWIWSMKDHLIKNLIDTGKTKVDARIIVENHIRASLDLKICLDIANSEKHSGLDRPSWSGLNPVLSEVGFAAPLGSIREISCGADGITLDVSKPELVAFHARVRDSKGNYLGDAIEILGAAVGQWESLLDGVRLGSSSGNAT